MAYSFKKTTKVESEVCPGVTFVIRKMTEGRRSEIRLGLAGLQDRLTDLSGDLRLLDPEKDEKALRAKAVEIDEFVLRELEVAKIKWSTARVEGLTFEEEDGTAVTGTLENVLDWPSELRGELLAIIDDGSVMLESEAKNYGPCTTFGALVARRNPSTTASSAANQSTDSTPAETVPDTFLAE